ncbi:MAG TPA: GNAT family N-acetyltransferase [Actinomycetota bacterium]|nr:GNAT family N-acetyltransferase [Actinomycetota bacterium]
MEFALVPDPAAYADRVEPFLLADEVLHNLALGIIANAGPDTVLALVERTGEGEGAVACAAVMVPPRNLVVSRSPTVGALAVLAHGLHDAGIALPGVVGPAAEALSFAGTWRGVALQPVHRRSAMQLYRADAVRDPAHRAAGRVRAATRRDADLVARWITAFNEEALPDAAHDPAAARRMAEDHIDRGYLWLWDDGEPVAMTAVGGSTRHGARVYAVYTPPAHRRRGYAATLVAEVTRQLLASGKHWACLFADMMNPTTNHIYQEIGYRPVAAFDDYRFGP